MGVGFGGSGGGLGDECGGNGGAGSMYWDVEQLLISHFCSLSSSESNNSFSSFCNVSVIGARLLAVSSVKRTRFPRYFASP